MICGRPKITVDFDDFEVEGGRILQCKIYNYPIAKGILRLLGIRRIAAEDIMASFSIKEHGSERVVFPGAVPHIISHTGTTDAQRISLGPSPFPAKFGVVAATYAEGKVKVFEQNVVLPIGLYSACVEVVAEGKLIRMQGDFAVTDEHPFVYWH